MRKYKLGEKENFLRAILREDPERVPCYTWGLRPEDVIPHVMGVGHVTAKQLSFVKRGVDAWGVRWDTRNERLISSYPIEIPIKSIEDLEKYELPDPTEPSNMEEVKKAFSTIDRNRYIALGDIPGAIYERSTRIFGMANTLMAMLRAQKVIKRFFHKICDYQVEIVKQYAESGAEMVKFCEDYGTQHSLQMSPALWRNMIKPELARLVKTAKKAGLMVWLHSCGAIGEIMVDIVEIGVDVIDPVQSRCNDLATFKKNYGYKICFMGAIDTQYTLMLGTPEEVQREVRERIRVLGGGGGYICSPEQPLLFPEENIAALVKSVEKYGSTTTRRAGKYKLDNSKV